MERNIPLKNFSDYFYENVSINLAPGQLQITSACNAKCFFCSNEQNPFKIERYKFRDLDEIKACVFQMDHNYRAETYLNESLPGRISEGEAFIHPQFFEILDIIRRKFNNVISTSTNGGLLSEEFISRLSRYGPMNITISFPSVNKDNWIKTFGLSEDAFYNALNAFGMGRQYGLNMKASMVPMPSYFGYNDIENTIAFFANQQLDNILIYSPGYTNRTKPEVVDRMKYDKDEMSDFFYDMRRKYRIAIECNLDPRIELNLNYQLLKNIVINSFHNNTYDWIFTSNSAFSRIKEKTLQMMREFPSHIDFFAVDNKTYGGNIECSGLWMIDDIEEKIKECLTKFQKPQNIYLPGVFIDAFGFDLQGKNIIDLQEKYREDNIFINLLKG